MKLQECTIESKSIVKGELHGIWTCSVSIKGRSSAITADCSFLKTFSTSNSVAQSDTIEDSAGLLAFSAGGTVKYGIFPEACWDEILRKHSL